MKIVVSPQLYASFLRVGKQDLHGKVLISPERKLEEEKVDI